MAASVFVDTNVLLRATISQFPLHREASSLIKSRIDAGDELWISRQVIREYAAQTTRPHEFMSPMTVEQLGNQVLQMMLAFKVADENEAVTRQLFLLLKAYPTGGRQIHDANIVATMLVNRVSILLTANVVDMKRFEDRIAIIPLATA